MKARWMLTAALTLGCGPGMLADERVALPDGATRLDDGAVVLEDGALYQPDAAVPEGPVCDADVQWFRQTLWTPLLAVQCVGCHNAAGAAATTRMVFRAESEAGWLEHNFRAVRAVAFAELAGVPQLLLRPSGRHPMGHTGGTLTAPGTSEYADLERFVARARTPTCNTAMPGQDSGTTMPPEPTRCTTVRPGARMLRRLTASEYDRTVRDLLGTTAQHGARFVADPVVDGFDNDAASLVVSPLLAEQLRVAAEALATEASAALPRVVPCTPASPTDAACARRFVESFGERAFRRPLAAEDVTRYVNLHATVAASEGFAEGVEAVVAAMLQSPHFLYRMELGVAMGAGYQLTPWEVATELSYLLTGTMPDAALFEAARSGALATPTGIEAQARRLLATPGAQESMRRFVTQWLDVDRLSSVPKDGTTFPAFTPAVRASMRGEFDRYVDAVLSRRGATLVELLTSPFTFVDPTLATFYGLTPEGAPDAQGFRRVSRLEAQRFGVLGLGAVQTTHARPNSSSPVHRGRLIRERLLCQTLPPPPPGVNAQPPAPDPSRTVREQYAMHASIRPCVDCHRLIDPIGFTFEFFDGVGRFRAMEAGRPVDGRGEIVGSRTSDHTFTDTHGLVEHLAASPEVHDCFARQVFRYAYATGAGEQTACALAEVQERFRGSMLSVDELFVALARSVHFTRREGPSAPVAPTPDAGVADAGGDAMVAAEAGTDAGRDAAMPTPDAMTTGPMTTAGVTTMTVRDSTWDTGFCERVIVTNGTAAPVDWTVVHTVEGTINTNWNSERTGDSGAVVFRGAMWNRTLGPRERTELGFCARR